ncbi:glycosyltransferase family 4 protein [Methanofollis ethanolicus]|uniref:glycosyltransferase family 4 protein n=1 Tax=Methanofollis ethanolicus TaxID=488124 RepID=UPI0009F81D04|nr:glycosyltransferase family 4 protein [Methanofollis ethanolicus]
MKPKLKIAIVSPWSRLFYLDNKGGTPTIYNLVKGLADAGHEVHMICPYEKGQRSIIPGLYIHSYVAPFFSLHIKNRILNGLYAKFKFFSLILFATIRAIRVSRKIDPDVVYGYAGSGAVTAYIISRLWKIPNITRLLGVVYLYSFIDNNLQLLLRFNEVMPFKLSCDALIITNDGSGGDKVANAFGFPEKKLKYWLNGVDEMYLDNFNSKLFKNSIGIDPDTKIILAISRLDKLKRVDRLIRVIPDVVSQINNVMFVIVGDGDERTSLENMVDNLGVRNYVTFTGTIPHDQVKYYLNSADIFVSLYDISNVGNPLLEAMMCGRCIVTLNTAATGDIIENNKNGLILDITSLHMLPRIMLELLEDEDLRIRLGKNARMYALEHFETWDQRIQKEVNFIEELTLLP